MKGARIKVVPPGPKAKAWIGRWRASGSKLSRFETAFSSAEGVYVEDVDGNRYLDFAALKENIGHSHPLVADAVIEQLKKTGVSSFRLSLAHELRVLAAEKIKEIAPAGLKTGKVDFCSTGSDAGEFAMKLSRAYTRKQLFLAYIGSHHGRSLGIMSLSADYSDTRRYCLPLVPGVVHIPYPYCYRCPLGQEYPDCDLHCLDFIQLMLDTVAHPDEVAALFIEPVMQVGGVVIPPKEYFPQLRKICDKYNILLVDDEAATGFGRTGKMFAIQKWGVTPEIMYTSKAMANGLTLAAIIAKKEIMDKEEEVKMVRGGSFAGNVLACAAALATIKVIEQEKLVEHSLKMGEYLMKRFSEMAEKYELIGDIRGSGLLIGLELVRDGKKPARTEAEKMLSEAFKKGLLLSCIGLYNNVIELVPPLVITKEQAEEGLGILEEIFRKL